MQLREIDKSIYQKHLRTVFIGMAVALLIISPLLSLLLIFMFSEPEASHFMHNVASALIAAAIVAFVLTKLRQHPYMEEVVYVWDLKQQLSQIHRRQRKIQAAVENEDRDAMIIINFQYRGSKQLYELDDNTITMEELNAKIIHHDQVLEQADLTISTDSFDPSRIKNY
ncbi:MAG: hypothetical protein COB26_09130 [Piscirickettsiaceae bacterium]|nr:MAG: hypothetical protein COB26_09130 [Piscirickettsiaceae bacterium]